MKKRIIDIVIILYSILAVFITISLLAYNDYGYTKLGSYTLITDTVKGYSKGNLLIVANDSDIKVGSNVFYYDVTDDDNVKVATGKITKVKVKNVVIDSHDVKRVNVFGSKKTITVIPVVGSILSLFESRVGYLCFIILPILIIFLYEITLIGKELKKKK